LARDCAAIWSRKWQHDVSSRIGHPKQLLRQLEGARIHKRDTIEIRAVDRALLDGLVQRMDRRMKFGLSVTHEHVYVTSRDGDTVDAAIARHALPPEHQPNA
jgi:hypothetical protein